MGRRHPSQMPILYILTNLRSTQAPNSGAPFKKRLAAFAICQTIDDAVKLGSTKSEPTLHRYNPNAALFYTIAQHYLNGGKRYITNGWRTLWHPTKINTFLEQVGFRKVYCKLQVELSPVAELFYRSHMATWGSTLGFNKVFGARWHQIEGLHKLIRIAKTFS